MTPAEATPGGAPTGVGLALSPEEFCAQARRLSGLDDFGPDDFRPGLERLHGSYTNDSVLNHVGSAAVSAHITMALVTRLRLVRLHEDRPGIFRQPLNEPLIVTGLPRSGTTFLHQLLCQLPDARWLPTWETREPIADSNADRRREHHARHLNLMRTFAPELEDKHPVVLDAPDECMYLLDPSFVSPSFSMNAPTWTYSSWLLDQDQRRPYGIYRELLQVIQATAPERRLILKSPGHVGMIEPLLAAVPEARIVQTHRDPMTIVPSMCSVLESSHRICSDGVERVLGGRRTLDHLARQCQRNMDQRRRLGAPPVVDVRFEELIREPLAAARAIHDRFGWQWTPDVEARLSAWIAKGPPRQVGRHRYSLEDYGLGADEIATRFADYRAAWGYA